MFRIFFLTVTGEIIRFLFPYSANEWCAGVVSVHVSCLFLFFRGEDDYMTGNIVEIELRNFMTFNNLTCKPGSRLNLVVGPNGAGKSSLVCAIALGLGGEPQVSARI